MLTGKLIRSTSLLDGDFFEDSIIYITAYDNEGASGFVINKRFPRRFNELVEFNAEAPFPMYAGGPVMPEQLFFLHRRADLIPGGLPVRGNICLGGGFNQALELMRTDLLASRYIKLFIGYCGWEFGELDNEIAEGFWTIDDTLFPLFQ